MENIPQRKDTLHNKNWWQTAFIRFGLLLMRVAGSKIKLAETKEETRDRRKGHLWQLVEAGYTIEKKTEYQFRINRRLDIYPTNAKWHDVKTGKRGEFHGQNICLFVRKYFKEI